MVERTKLFGKGDGNETPYKEAFTLLIGRVEEKLLYLTRGKVVLQKNNNHCFCCK